MENKQEEITLLGLYEDLKLKMEKYFEENPDTYKITHEDRDFPQLDLFLDKNKSLPDDERTKIMSITAFSNSSPSEIVLDWESGIRSNRGKGFIIDKLMEMAKSGKIEYMNDEFVKLAVEFESSVERKIMVLNKHPAMDWNTIKKEIILNGTKEDAVEKNKDLIKEMATSAILLNTKPNDTFSLLSTVKHVAQNIETTRFQAQIMTIKPHLANDIRKMNREKLIENVFSAEM